MTSKVTIIILNWNGKEDTIECLESLKQITYPNYEILLVDNGSTDGSVKYFKEHYKEIEIIENKENLGFAEGNNIAIKKAIERRTDYLLLLNNDTTVDPEFLTKLVNVAESNPKAGILGPKIYYYDSKRIQSCGGHIDFFRGIVSGQSRYRKYSYNHDIVINTDFLTGCAILVKTEVFKNVGLLDISYFAYYEDTDLCVRTKSAGYDLLCVQTSIIWHKGSQSSKVNRSGLYYGTRNMILFEKKYATNIQFIIFVIYFTFVRLPFLVGISLIYHRSLLSLKKCVNGTIDGFSQLGINSLKKWKLTKRIPTSVMAT